MPIPDMSVALMSSAFGKFCLRMASRCASAGELSVEWRRA